MQDARTTMNDAPTHEDAEQNPTAAFEEAVSQIPGVRGVRIAASPAGTIEEVHVLSNTERAPKQLVRDVQSVLNVRFGLEIDYRVVSVVQLGGEESPVAPGAEASAKRPVVLRVISEVHGLTSTVTVDLGLGDGTASGTAKGSTHASPRLVAAATVDAVSSILPGLAPEVEYASIVDAAGMDVALVVLRVAVARTDVVLTGSAGALRDPHDAVARATLAALNRTLGG